MRLCVLWCKQYEDTFKNTQRRKVKQMQPVWLCILSGRSFEDTFENAQWRKVKQMQPAWFYMFWSKFFEETCEKTHWTKVKQMQRGKIDLLLIIFHFWQTNQPLSIDSEVLMKMMLMSRTKCPIIIWDFVHLDLFRIRTPRLPCPPVVTCSQDFLHPAGISFFAHNI